jgi:hypothetical protein
MASPAGETTRPMQGNRTRNITLAELATQCTEEEPTNEAETVSSVAISSPESINRESCQSIGNPERGVDGTEGARLPMVTESPATSGSGRSVHIIQEIIDTEKTYVQDLWDVINGYETPCIDTQIFDDDEDFISLFGNMDELYDFNSSLLCQLEQADGDPVKIGSCFIENEQKFHQYTLYCTNYPRSVAVLTSYTQLKNKVADFLKTCQKALGHALPLGSYLLKPVQRILKYRLLLMDLVKHTDLSTEGNAILEKALSTMTSVAEHINEMKKLHEATVRVQEIQSLLTDWKGEDLTKYGRLVLEDSFRVVGARDPRQVFLFEKLVLVTKHRDDGKYSYKNHFETGDMTLTESIGREPTSLSFQICPYQNVRDSITIQTGTLEIKQKWIATIRRLIIDSWPNLPPKARKIVLGLQEGKGQRIPCV